MTACVVLIRHAEPTRWSRGRAIGRTDVGLSREGARQAWDIADRLAELDATRLVSSPSRRAVLTARAIARTLRLPVELEPDVREIDFGEVDGRTFESIERERPELYAAWMRSPTTVAFPGGERWSSLRGRVDAAMGRLADAGRGTTLLVTHLGPMLAVLGRSRALADDDLFRMEVAHGSALSVELTAAGERREYREIADRR
jgi:probable phosphoglycerate mutase